MLAFKEGKFSKVGLIPSCDYVLVSAGLPLSRIQYFANLASQTDHGYGLTKHTDTNTCHDLCYLHSYLSPISTPSLSASS